MLGGSLPCVMLEMVSLCISLETRGWGPDVWRKRAWLFLAYHVRWIPAVCNARNSLSIMSLDTRGWGPDVWCTEVRFFKDTLGDTYANVSNSLLNRSFGKYTKHCFCSHYHVLPFGNILEAKIIGEGLNSDKLCDAYFFYVFKNIDENISLKDIPFNVNTKPLSSHRITS